MGWEREWNHEAKTRENAVRGVGVAAAAAEDGRRVRPDGPQVGGLARAVRAAGVRADATIVNVVRSMIRTWTTRRR